jgi:hypothetical protein
MEKLVPCKGLHLVQVLVPAGSADNNAAAESEHGAHVFQSRFGGGEVDHRVDLRKIRRSESRGVRVLVDVEGADGMAALAGHLGDQTSGFSLT